MDPSLRNLDDLLRDHFRYGVVAILDAEGVRRRFSSGGGCVAGSINDFAEPVELLSCAGSCTCSGSRTCAPHLTSLVPSCAPLLTPLCARHAPPLTPLVPCCTPLHASGRSRRGRSRRGLSLSIGYCQYRRGRREAERSRQSHQ